MQDLGEFIRRHRELIISKWLEQVSALPSAEGKPPSVLRDDVPSILDHLAEELVRDTPRDALPESTARHAVQRYREGYDLRQVVLEYQALRRTIHTLYAGSAPVESTSLERRAQFEALVDEAVGDAVEQFVQEHDRVRDVFIAVLGHDLRNPLQAIVAASAVLVRQGGDEARSAQTIHRSARRMDRMIADLLDFARKRLGGRIPLSLAPADLAPIVDAVAQEIREVHPTRAISVVVEAGASDLAGEWDGDRLAQALSNLVGNAVEHGEDPIVVRLVADGPSVVVEVCNRGTIAEDARAVLFQPFRATSASQGLGLGLYVVREIARAHGGDVEVSTREDRTVFRVTLPRRPFA